MKQPKRKQTSYMNTEAFRDGGYKPTGRPLPPINPPSDLVIIHASPEDVNAGLKQKYGSKLMGITQRLSSRQGSDMVGAHSITLWR